MAENKGGLKVRDNGGIYTIPIVSWKQVLILSSIALNVAFFVHNLNLNTFSSGKSLSFYSTAAVVVDNGQQQQQQQQQKLSSDSVINLDHGDPTMYEPFWRKFGDKSTIVIPGWQAMSYFSDVGNICWFLEPEFADEIRRLHKLVGNANTEGSYIVVGTGSTQLFQAALYALSPPDATDPISVVSAAPFYSSYPSVTDFLKSGLYKWAGDAYTFDKEGPYIELVTTPNNPDGYSRGPVVKREGGIIVYDMAYYWPHYTPITSTADHDLMLFTLSKVTGHAGTRLGWALVKDRAVAMKMTKFIELNSIGISKDSQLRAVKILKTLSDSCEEIGSECFFDYGNLLMTKRWEQLRDATKRSGMFSLPDFSQNFCNYTRQVNEPHPAFAWMKCEGGVEDCQKFLKEHKILTRSGKHFGQDPKYVRVSMLDRDGAFELFVERLSNIHT
ncbi:L-tryptophan--pyruvate aminotransferase [Ranunculus cassubicifolius]